MSTHQLELGTLLRRVPSCWRTMHPIRDIEIADSFGWLNPLWSKRQAARVALLANMEQGVARGKGSRAAKRAAVIETNKWFDSLPKLSDADLGVLMEHYYAPKRPVPSFPNYPQLSEF